MADLNSLIGKKNHYLFYGLTPPKVSTSEEKRRTIADKQVERIAAIAPDGLLLYDVQDESSRTAAPRPFPYESSIAPEEYRYRYLQAVSLPTILYKSVGNLTPEAFPNWIQAYSSQSHAKVLVGAPSTKVTTSLTLAQAYQLVQSSAPDVLLGGVAIPERHQKRRDEHLRWVQKTSNGCQFFVTQCVYDVNSTKDVLSDYYYHLQETQQVPVPIIFTLTPCGSIKTLEFMEWLGIHIPVWLRNDMLHAPDVLQLSIRVCIQIAKELSQYCSQKSIPYGFNIESVAIRKEEIEASIYLAQEVKKLF
ncbi:MAG: methylenetetrahydrofolate reductase [Cytophagaceae bacterium]|jgi:hypothetical protein|nr:methylenetetrahydrofolate reductase [Cytophagaceae bacterium]